MQEVIGELIGKYVPFFPVQNDFSPPIPSEISIPKKVKE